MAQEFPSQLIKHFFSIGNETKPNDHFFGQFSNEQTSQNKSIETTNNESEESRDELSLINQEVLNHLRTIVPELKFSTYFENSLELKSIANQNAIFEVRTAFIKKSAELYKEEIAKSIYNVLGTQYEIIINAKDQSNDVAPNFSSANFHIKDTSDRPRAMGATKFTLDLTPTRDDLKSRVDAEYIEHMNPNKSGIRVDRSKTFDNFIVGPTNNIAQAASKAVALNPGKDGKYPSLYIHSNSGLGKTHLLHAVANEIAEKHPSYNICLITTRDFMEEMIGLMKINKINDFFKKYTERVDVLMIDDIHELKNKEGTQDQFFHVFNEMHNKGKQLIFTSDKNPKEITGISERIKSRLQWGLVVDIQPPDLETRIAILRRKMEALDLYINEDVLTLIASRIKTNIRELEGSLVRLKAVSELMNVEIEVDLVKEQLMLPNSENEKEITIESVAKATAQYFRLPLADLKSKGRNQDITKARHVAMYLARKVVNAKQQEIGAYFGGRDHSSVIHAVNTISEKVKTDSSLSKDINAIESNL
ncbi:chromosomal replication initiator protein DnaA [Bacteriovorax sp. PP10]|uniref:Chromosomal replication initiator protein DnaA n=1 Tax=Bacteriovorax antarcticus TaxID=3088717 RepID=A0ABU5VP31_9BACT|nr:chromosomal replication initiator protein DnaA [Bacteriovorax sp. PP10]MEA9354793.1 chromosomal replication initiator protein DnaA [Bacteriovorax sp. PP10]